MSEKGYISQYDSEWTKTLRGSPIPDELRVAIARDGSLIRCASGRHRLAIAKLLDVRRIYALAQLRHETFDGELDVIRQIKLSEAPSILP